MQCHIPINACEQIIRHDPNPAFKDSNFRIGKGFHMSKTRKATNPKTRFKILTGRKYKGQQSPATSSMT